MVGVPGWAGTQGLGWFGLGNIFMSLTNITHDTDLFSSLLWIDLCYSCLDRVSCLLWNDEHCVVSTSNEATSCIENVIRSILSAPQHSGITWIISPSFLQPVLKYCAVHFAWEFYKGLHAPLWSKYWRYPDRQRLVRELIGKYKKSGKALILLTSSPGFRLQNLRS